MCSNGAVGRRRPQVSFDCSTYGTTDRSKASDPSSSGISTCKTNPTNDSSRDVMNIRLCAMTTGSARRSQVLVGSGSMALRGGSYCETVGAGIQGEGPSPAGGDGRCPGTVSMLTVPGSTGPPG